MPAVVIATGIGAGACSSSEKSASWIGPPTVVVTMREYRFEFKGPIPGGRVVFEVENAGDSPHRLTMVPLTEDVPAIDEQLRGRVRLTLAPYAGIPTMPPGQKAIFAVDLVPDRRYAFISFVQGPDGESDALRGMNAEFRAGPVPRSQQP